MSYNKISMYKPGLNFDDTVKTKNVSIKVGTSDKSKPIEIIETDVEVTAQDGDVEYKKGSQCTLWWKSAKLPESARNAISWIMSLDKQNEDLSEEDIKKLTESKDLAKNGIAKINKNGEKDGIYTIELKSGRVIELDFETKSELIARKRDEAINRCKGLGSVSSDNNTMKITFNKSCSFSQVQSLVGISNFDAYSVVDGDDVDYGLQYYLSNFDDISDGKYDTVSDYQMKDMTIEINLSYFDNGYSFGV